VSVAPLKEAGSEVERLKAHTYTKNTTIGEYWNNLLNLDESGQPYGFFGGDAKYCRVLKRLLRLRLTKLAKANAH